MEVQQHRVNTSLENLKEVSFTSNSKLVPLASMTFIHPAVRKLFTEEIPNVPRAERLPQFVKQWEKITRDRVSDTIQKSPSSGETSKDNKNVRTTISANGPGSIRDPGEESYSESRNSSRGVSEQHFSYGKEGWGKLPGDKSGKTQCIHPLRGLPNGRFALSEISSGTKRLPVQDRSRRSLLCNSFQQTVIKICEVQMGRQPLRVSLSLLWFRASSKSFYPITKNPNCSFETNKHLDNCLFG